MLKKSMTYFSYSDILAKLGGYKSILDPIFVAILPFFTLSYLHKLSRIIKQTRMKEYVKEMKKLSFELHNMLKKDKKLV